MKPLLSLILSLFCIHAFTATKEEIEQALREKNVHILIVRGFQSRPGSPMDRPEYRPNTRELVRLFERMGYSASVSKASQDGSVQSAISVVSREVIQSPKLVLLVGHSMGGIKGVASLLSSSAALENTAGLILVHCPNWGAIAVETMVDLSQPEAPFVDLADTSLDGTRAVQQGVLNFFDPWGVRRLNPLWNVMEDGWYVAGKAANSAYKSGMDLRTQILFELVWGGDSSLLRDISREYRRWYMERYENSFRNWGIPILAVRGFGGRGTPFYEMLRPHGRNDGVLLTEEQSFLSGRGFSELSFDVNHMSMFIRPSAFSGEWQECLGAVYKASKDSLAENAGRNLADLARMLRDLDLRIKRL